MTTAERGVEIPMAEGTRVRVLIEETTEEENETEAKPRTVNLFISLDEGIQPKAPGGGLRDTLSRGMAWLSARLQSWPYSLPQTLFGAGLVIYLATRLIGLSNYPIYFFTDEAIQTNLAADFLRDNFRNHEGELFPTYFQNVDKYSLSVSVYAQVLPYLFFGRSVFVTRAVSVVVSALGALWVGLTLRDSFKNRYWWSGALLLSIAPAWFLHSRTAFETVLMASFFAGFLYYYLLYRTKERRYLYHALILGALAFYSYNPGRVVIVLTGVLLLLSDLKYHLADRKIALRALGILALLALPFLRFQLAHPTANVDQLRLLASYWVQPIPLEEKIATLWREYTYGMSPGYWFVPNNHDLRRHVMDGYGHLPSTTLPFALLGLGLTIASSLRSSTHRALLAAFLAAPSGAALVGVGVTRALAFVIPAVLLIGLGVSAALEWLHARGVPRRFLALGLFSLLAAVNVGMLADALVNGPTWHRDYSLGGMQYGARQVFGAVEEYLEENPSAELIVSPDWTNGANVVADFFFPMEVPFQFGSIEGYVDNLMEINPETVFVMTAREYELAISSGKFTDVQVERTIPYPDGRTGFYFVRLHYKEGIEKIMAAELAARRELVQSIVQIEDQIVTVRHSRLDMGDISLLFDGDPFTVGRTMDANPFVIDMEFPQPRQIRSVKLRIGSINVEVVALVYTSSEGEPMRFSGVFSGSLEEPDVILSLGEKHPVHRLRLEVRDLNQGDPGHVHVWEVEFE